MPLQATSGAASYDAFGGGVPAGPAYIEDVFSTYLYTGNGSTQTITNNIDLSSKGGLVWLKSRSAATDNFLFDTVRGALNELNSNTMNAQVSLASSLTAFNTTGFSLGSAAGINVNAATYTSWSFRKQPKFFDVVTYTGNNSTNVISHSLNSTPACIIVKRTGSAGDDWWVYHKDIAAAENSRILLNTISAPFNTGGQRWATSSTTFTVFGSNGDQNASGSTYIAYLFASNAGGFGLLGTDNVITCGAYTGNGSATGPVVTLGYEPQWLMIKNASGTGNWQILDNMRGLPVGSADALLLANEASAETSTEYVSPTATGFQVVSTSSQVNTNASTYIYIAIRRGPMKVPTSGTSVFGMSARTGTGANATVTGGQTDDAVLVKNRGSAVGDLFSARLTGTGYLETSSAAAEVAAGTTILQDNPWDVMDGVKVGTTSTITNATSNTFINYLFKRAPSFFDVVCYKGNGTSGTQISHNLTVAPELIIVKKRSSISTNVGWPVWSNQLSFVNYYLRLNQTTQEDAYNGFFTASGPTPTATTFTIGNDSDVNTSGQTYIAYLFATLAGVSKVGKYTGTGATQTISCGFTGGARFVMIKRINSTGDWYVWDTARGMVSGTDPSILLNSTAAEVNANSVYTTTGGFQIVSTAAGINASGGTYLYLAIA
jgi:hypothetical protein